MVHGEIRVELFVVLAVIANENPPNLGKIFRESLQVLFFMVEAATKNPVCGGTPIRE